MVVTVDIRAAAQREAKRLRVAHNGREYGMAKLYKDAFVDGAVWAAALVTPTREQIAETLVKRRHPRLHWPAETQTQIGQTALRDAGAILALLGGLAEGESSG